MRTIPITIDLRLLKAVDMLTLTRGTRRSALMRTAFEAELRRDRISKLEARHTKGYARLPQAPGEFDWFES